MNLRDAIQVWRDARDAHAELDRQKKEAAKDVQRAARDVREALLDQGLQNVRCEDGATIYLHNIFSISVTQDNESAVRAWLIDEFGDDQPFVQEKVSKSALSAHLKDAIEKGELGEFDVPEFLKLNTHPDVRIRR